MSGAGASLENGQRRREQRLMLFMRLGWGIIIAPRPPKFLSSSHIMHSLPSQQTTLPPLAPHWLMPWNAGYESLNPRLLCYGPARAHAPRGPGPRAQGRAFLYVRCPRIPSWNAAAGPIYVQYPAPQLLLYITVAPTVHAFYITYRLYKLLYIAPRELGPPYIHPGIQFALTKGG